MKTTPDDSDPAERLTDCELFLRMSLASFRKQKKKIGIIGIILMMPTKIPKGTGCTLKCAASSVFMPTLRGI